MSKELDGLKEQIKLLQKKIELLEQKENKQIWKPQIGHEYYSINHCLEIIKNKFEGDTIDKKLFDVINIYPTKEQAERKAFEQLIHRKLEKFAYENNENEIDWNNTDKNKYYIYYDYDDNCLDVDYIYDYRDFGQIYFTSQEIAKKAIKTFENDLIRFFTTNK